MIVYLSCTASTIIISMSIYEEDRRYNRVITEDERPREVGSSGKYQKCMLFIFMLNWFVTGVILLSTAFFFRKNEFDCQNHGLLVSERDCTTYVCSLQEADWSQYISQDDSFVSLANADNYLCDNAITIDFVSSCTYIGAFLGYIILSFFADNFGRKKTILISWTICVIGTIIVATSFHLYMAAIGFFLSGFGSDASIGLCLIFFGQCTGPKKRQKYSIIVQIFFCLGALTTVLFFFIFAHWRVSWCFLVTAPALIQLLLLQCYIQQTPDFLIRKGLNQAIDGLNRIGKINLDRKSTIQEQDIQNVIQYQQTEDFENKLVTPLDLWRFSSLRLPTITCGILSFVTYAMYYGPALIINEVGLDIYVSNLIIQLSEIVIYLPAYFYIDKIKRKNSGILLFSIASFVSFILVLIQKPQDCDGCYHVILQLITVFIFRACVSLFFCFFLVYTCEIYPARIRGIGTGIVSSFGTLATILNPIYIGAIRNNGLNAFTLLLILGLIAIGCLKLLPQTKSEKMMQQIQEIQKIKQRKRAIVPMKSPKTKRRNYKSQLTYDKANSMSSRMIQSNRLEY